MKKIGRWLAIGFGALFVLLVVVGMAARLADGPIGPFPGGPLRAGERVQERDVDWTFAADIDRIELQLQTPARSRTTWLVVHERALYIPCGAPLTPLKQWPRHALADGRALLRVEGRLYERQAVKVTDRKLFEQLAALLGEKYPIVWFFRMEPRAAGSAV